MKLLSTRKKSAGTTFNQALFKGLAPDGGLYHPIEKSDLSTLFLSFTENTPFSKIAEAVSLRFLEKELDQKIITKIVKRAFNFTPVLRRLNKNIHLLELFHGPSCAFKDFGACFLASFMEEILLEKNKRAIILVATSGDTGSAVAQAFHNKESIDVVILYPSKRVSFLQEKQLTTLGGNVYALEVKGAFDDCQRLAKEAFQDNELKSKLSLTSANSINIGRLFPQSFYYIFAYAQLQKEARDNLYFCVPSGNFGNLTAGVYAWSWGLPVLRFIAATNINDVVPEYLETGIYKPRPSIKTLSNAMDVGNPSNFERLLEIFAHDQGAMADKIVGQVVNDKDTLLSISEIYKEKGIFIDPHTAVGYLAAKRYLKINGNSLKQIIVLATAHAGKFPETIKQATGKKIEPPPAINKLLSKKKQSLLIENNINDLKSFLLNTFA